MNETTNPTAIVTQRYRQDLKRMTYRAFAEALNEKQVNGSVSHATVMNWEKGMTEPDTDYLLRLMVIHPVGDWRRQFAIEVLQAKLPEVFERTNNGMRILI